MALKSNTEKAADKKTVEKKSSDKVTKPAEEKATKKPAAKKNPKVLVTLQIYGNDVLVEDVVKRATKHFKKLRKDVEVKTLEVYVNIDERKAYYVVNKEQSDEFVVDL